MCTDEQHQDRLQVLKNILKNLARDPVDIVININDNKPWTVDYQGYQHIFLWIPGNALSMNMGEYGTGTVAAQVWINLGFKAGTVIKTSGQTTNVPLILRFTNEVIA